MNRDFRRKIGSESGQAAVLVAMLCAVLVIAMAMTTNLGKVVTEKMAMQNAVDLAAYSGAATEAGYLNEMRKINQDIYDKLHDERSKLEPSEMPGDPQFLDPSVTCLDCPLPIMSNPEMEIELTMTLPQELDMKRQNLERKNRDGYTKSKEAAQEAADKNYKGTKNKLNVYSPPASNGGMYGLSVSHVDEDYFGWCYGEPPDCVTPLRATMVKHHSLDAWEFKQDQGNAMVAVGIEGAHPDSPFMDIPNNYFTPTSCEFGTLSSGRCSLDVYAIAAPYYGKVGTKPNGAAPWEMEIIYNEPTGMSVDRADQLEPEKIVRGENYKDYKVRFVGIFEDQAKVVNQGTAVKGMMPYGNKQNH